MSRRPNHEDKILFIRISAPDPDDAFSRDAGNFVLQSRSGGDPAGHRWKMKLENDYNNVSEEKGRKHEISLKTAPENECYAVVSFHTY